MDSVNPWQVHGQHGQLLPDNFFGEKPFGGEPI